MKIDIQEKSSTKKQTFWSDLKNYFLHKPEIPTLIDFETLSEREDYSKRILQRRDDIIKYLEDEPRKLIIICTPEILSLFFHPCKTGIKSFPLPESPLLY